MHIHGVLLGLQWLKEADISQLQIVVACKPCPPFVKLFEFASIFGKLNAARHTTTRPLIKGILLKAFFLNCLNFLLSRGILTKSPLKLLFLKANIQNAFNCLSIGGVS
jgi:hypothetical protein